MDTGFVNEHGETVYADSEGHVQDHPMVAPEALIADDGATATKSRRDETLACTYRAPHIATVGVFISQ